MSAAVPLQMAAVGEMAPYDASETMIPSPLSCSTRYGMRAATPTRETSIPSAGLWYLEMKKSACETSRRPCEYRQIAGSRKYDRL